MVKKRLRSSLKRAITQWHRRLGILSALVVMLISFTGILLNHSDDLGLPSSGVQTPWLLSLYNIEIPEVISFDGGDEPVLQLGHSLYVADTAVDQCHSVLIGAVYVENLHYIACKETLAIYTSDLQLVERITAAYGLPQPLDKIGASGNKLVVASAEQFFMADTDIVEWQPVAENAVISWSQQTVPSQDLVNLLRANFTSDISWERVILDFHAGRFLGKLGPAVMDVFALCFIMLALTGCWLWLRGRKAR